MPDSPPSTPDNGSSAPSAVLFGSIGTIADTSELQRQAFNDAFEANGLDWRWEREDYLAMLEGSGGQNRIADYASSVGQEVDAEAIHRSKSELFQRSLAESDLAPRDGVAETVRAAKDEGVKVALVTTTSIANIESLIEAMSPALEMTDFDLVVDSSDVAEPKPDREAYSVALDGLGERAEDCVAIEDNVGGVKAAVAAGVRCVAFPNQNTAGHDFAGADRRVEALDLHELGARA